jgi:endonuclease III related protein
MLRPRINAEYPLCFMVFRVYPRPIRAIRSGFAVAFKSPDARSPDSSLLYSSVTSSNLITQIFRTLARHYGPLHWWPAQTRFEVIVGAFLTQNTSWNNVELTLKNLRRAGVLSTSGIRGIALPDLEQLVRPSGYYRQKAGRLKMFVAHLDARYKGSLNRMFRQPVDVLRTELLSQNGIGPETADAILLYAGKLPVFVVDAYTKRIFERHGICEPGAKYEHVRNQVETAFALRFPAVELADHYNEFHALIVQVGKDHCGRVAQCEGCPLQCLLPAEASQSQPKETPARRY